MRPAAATVPLALVTALVLSCSAAPGTVAPPPAPPPAAPPPEPARPTPESVRANELGDVPVLMYHRVTPEPTSAYDRTPADFRAELERLAAEGYVPVTATEYATGRIDIPAGRHPVVLTFDDGSPTQFAVDAAGNPLPGTAIAVLREVAAAHPGFRPVATCYVVDPPFGEPGGERTLRALHELGVEIGNHTAGHPNLGRLGAAEVRSEIAGMQRIITDAVPGLAVRSLALPLGARPDDPALAVAGAAEGTAYRHDSVMLVGSNPAPSPWAADFDPAAVPRIRSQGPTGPEAEFGSTAWLDELAADPARRYTSDGDPDRISAPADAAEPRLDVEVHRY
ncbi:polysaccharide deacetylase family protein [Saccharopolyspora sp. CA-218241]|uniref:polysaccharide deacetylase family protein n=1 Tax=Saccharopolyspora sp. CA-218241 TaxID=3240027 RepID=UPI003D95F1E2